MSRDSSMTEAELELMVLGLQPLVGLPLQRIVQPDDHTLALRWMRRWMLLCARPGMARVHPLEHKPLAPPNPPAFCMLLRKQLLNRRLGGVLRRPGDRVLQLELSTGQLVAELFGSRTNLLLLDSQGVVLGALRARNLRNPVGSSYQPPPPGPGSPRKDQQRFATGAEAEVYYQQLTRQQQRESLLRSCTRALRRAQRALHRVEQDVQRCQQADQYKKWADLLLAQQHLAPPRGAISLQVADLFGDGGPLQIPLDPNLNLMQNAQRLYKRQRRLHTGAGHAAARLEQVGTVVDQLSDLQQQLQVQSGTTRLVDLEAQLTALAAPRSAAPRSAPHLRRSEKPLPYRTFEAADGSPILVGRSARDNHALTFHHARGKDTWLHLRDQPGCHGVIRAAGLARRPDHQALLDAGTLVAHFSGIKVGETVDISHALRKDVRPAGKPGQVYVSQSKTLHLILEQARLDRLLHRQSCR